MHHAKHWQLALEVKTTWDACTRCRRCLAKLPVINHEKGGGQG